MEEEIGYTNDYECYQLDRKRKPYKITNSYTLFTDIFRIFCIIIFDNVA